MRTLPILATTAIAVLVTSPAVAGPYVIAPNTDPAIEVIDEAIETSIATLPQSCGIQDSRQHSDGRIFLLSNCGRESSVTHWTVSEFDPIGGGLRIINDTIQTTPIEPIDTLEFFSEDELYLPLPYPMDAIAVDIATGTTRIEPGNFDQTQLVPSGAMYRARHGVFKHVGGSAVGVPVTPVITNVFDFHVDDTETYVYTLSKIGATDLMRLSRIEIATGTMDSLDLDTFAFDLEVDGGRAFVGGFFPKPPAPGAFAGNECSLQEIDLLAPTMTLIRDVYGNFPCWNLKAAGSDGIYLGGLDQLHRFDRAAGTFSDMGVATWTRLHTVDAVGCLTPDDRDCDGIENIPDNCPDTYNPSQDDLDGDGIGDVCDEDLDGDTVPNTADNCPFASNQNQADADGDHVGDACDNCPGIHNPNQGSVPGKAPHLCPDLKYVLDVRWEALAFELEQQGMNGPWDPWAASCVYGCDADSEAWYLDGLAIVDEWILTEWDGTQVTRDDALSILMWTGDTPFADADAFLSSTVGWVD